jgi:hypothetical protein
VEDELIKLTKAVENDYIRDFVRARLLPKLQGNLQPKIEEQLVSVFLKFSQHPLPRRRRFKRHRIKLPPLAYPTGFQSKPYIRAA